MAHACIMGAEATQFVFVIYINIFHVLFGCVLFRRGRRLWGNTKGLWIAARFRLVSSQLEPPWASEAAWRIVGSSAIDNIVASGEAGSEC